MQDTYKMDRKYPNIDALRAATKKRIPHFAWEYLHGGIDNDLGKLRNRQSLAEVRLMPEYLSHSGAVLDTTTSILGQEFAAPFGVAPIGLGGLMWPKVAEYLAASAKKANLPFAMSSFTTASLETIRAHAGENGWFQLYRPNDPEVREMMLSQAETAGFDTILLTVDIPTLTRRKRELAVGLSVPPKMTISNVLQMIQRPKWLWKTFCHETPKFHVLQQHVPSNLGQQGATFYISELIKGHQSIDDLKSLRDRWKGKLLIKGLQSISDVSIAKELGYDGVVVSNHGGRQLEAAPSTVDVLPQLRAAFPDYTLIADSGARNGADIAKMIALGADMVLLGRAMMYGVCGAGEAGADHVMHILMQEFTGTMAQLGVTRPDQLRQCIYKM